MCPKVVDGQHIVGPEEGMPDWMCIFLIDVPADQSKEQTRWQGQEALDRCLDIEKKICREFLEMMDVQKR